MFPCSNTHDEMKGLFMSWGQLVYRTNGVNIKVFFCFFLKTHCTLSESEMQSEAVEVASESPWFLSQQTVTAGTAELNIFLFTGMVTTVTSAACHRYDSRKENKVPDWWQILQCLKSLTGFYLCTVGVAGRKSRRLHRPHQLHDWQSHRVQEETVSCLLLSLHF